MIPIFFASGNNSLINFKFSVIGAAPLVPVTLGIPTSPALFGSVTEPNITGVSFPIWFLAACAVGVVIANTKSFLSAANCCIIRVWLLMSLFAILSS